ncbi:ATP-binding protein [Kitasatospora sp. NPDC057015]|uniref:ATP-binding protein n=1 Tax=Kitasatospora sp. NPDC057015 TaxID=3346001 RepID=UPI003630246C
MVLPMRSGGGRPVVEGEHGFVLVGREDELSLLTAALRSLPAVLMVEGEAGVGKSRLVREATAPMAGQGTRLLTGFCHPLREPLPFGPVLEALRPVAEWLPPPETLNPQVGALAPLLPELARHLPPAPDQLVDARGRRFQLVGAVRSVLEVVGPAVLVVEDLHWVDEATRELLLLLARDMPKRLALVLTYRGEDLAPDVPVLGTPYRRPVGTGGAEIHLDALAEPDLFELASAVLGRRATPELAGTLYERSAGLPLIAEEDLLTLREHQLRHQREAAGHSGGNRQPDGSEWRTSAARRARSADEVFVPRYVNRDELAVLARAEVPRYLREAITERLAGLSVESRTVVEAAAVLAVPTDQDLLTEVTGLGPAQVSAGLAEALRATILREIGPARYGFRHTLAQQAVYRNLLGPRRLELHRQAVRRLWTRPSPPLVQIAYHTKALGDVQAWLHQAEAAADQAIAVGDDGTATALIDEILAQPNLEGDLRTRAALALARVAKEGIEFTRTITTLRRILIDPQLPTAARGEIRLTLGVLMLNQNRDRAGFPELEQAVEELDTRPDLAVRALNALTADERRRYPQGPRVWEQRLLAWLDATEETLRVHPDETVWAAVCATRLNMMVLVGDPAARQLVDQLPRTSSDHVVQRQINQALHNVGAGAVQAGQDEQAFRLLTESSGLARQLGYHLLEGYSRLDLLRLDWLAGRWHSLEEDYARLKDAFPDLTTLAVEAALTLGQLAAARGQWRSALDQLDQVAGVIDRSDESEWISRSAMIAARVNLAREQPRAAWDAVAPALAFLRLTTLDAQGWGLLPVAVQAALVCGHQDTARELAAAAEQVVGVRGKDMPAVEAEFRLAHGLLLLDAGDFDAAADEFDRVRLLYDVIGRPYDAAQATELLATTRTDAAPYDAATHLTNAATAFTALGSVADAARCQQALRDLGLARPTPRGRRGYGTELSPREKQVADLLADGASNQDIAQALSLSKRTVEMHVTNTLKKLHTTRDALTDRN